MLSAHDGAETNRLAPDGLARRARRRLVNQGHAWDVREEIRATMQDHARAAVSPHRPSERPGAGRPVALAVADANWYTTENLFGAVQRTDAPTLLLKCIDYYNAWQRGLPPWAWRRALH